MKILLYIPKEIDSVDIYHDMTDGLITYIGHNAEVVKTSQRPIFGKQKKKSDADNAPLSVNDFDLVHVFGCWNRTASSILLKAGRHGVPTVFSPLGGLQPWVIRKHKADRASMYRAVAAASAIHVCGTLELTTFQALDWNKKTAVIKNPILTRAVTMEQMAADMCRLYQKVLDSNVNMLIDDEVEDAIGYLLLAGLDGEALRNKERKKNILEALHSLTPAQWRLISIYAHDEQIADRINAGISRLQYDAPHTDVEALERFPVTLKLKDGPLETNKLLAKSPLLRTKLNEVVTEKYPIERQLCIMFLNIRSELHQRSMPMRHLADIYDKIKSNNYDEDKLKDILRQMDILPFASRIVFILHDVIGLTEGFMPFEGKDDKTTDKIRTNITHLK